MAAYCEESKVVVQMLHALHRDSARVMPDNSCKEYRLGGGCAFFVTLFFCSRRKE